MRSPLRSVLPASVCAIVLASCGGGGSSSADFTSGYEDVRADMLDLGTTVGQSISHANGRSDRDLASEFNGYVSQADDISARLDALDPPSDTASDFDDLKTAFSVVQADLDKIASAAESHDPQAAFAGSASLVADSNDVKSTREAVDKDVGLNE